tara:strand:+ start:47371 stop:47643 length:273 start_codon:yes stop_codon:yes gene_type:complete
MPYIKLLSRHKRRDNADLSSSTRHYKAACKKQVILLKIMKKNAKIDTCQLLKIFLASTVFSFVALIAMNQCMSMFKERIFFASFGSTQLF